MVVVGVDTSGKVNQPPLYVAAVKLENRDNLLKILREKASKRKSGLLSRKSIKAIDLTSNELKFFVDNLKQPYSVSVMTSSSLENIVKKFRHEKNWEFKLLAAQIHFVCDKYIKSGDVIVVDRDYTSPVMDELSNYVKRLFERDSKRVHVLIGSRYTEEAIQLADLVAGSARKRIIKPKVFDVKDAELRIKFL